MFLPIPVFTKAQAEIKRGSHAEAMLPCTNCGLIAGVLINEINRVDTPGCNREGGKFTTIVWERWTCQNCGKVWIEKYGIGCEEPPANDIESNNAIVVTPSSSGVVLDSDVA